MVLTTAILVRTFYNLTLYAGSDALDSNVRDPYEVLRRALYNHFTSVGDIDLRTVLRSLTERYAAVLSALNLEDEVMGKCVSGFIKALKPMIANTPYLCWIEAEPGEVVNLQAVYTAKDERYLLERDPEGSALKSLIRAMQEPRYWRKPVWARWYREFGLAPINYELDAPGDYNAASYYFTIEPPKGTEVAYLDWELGNSIENDEVDCAFYSAHVYTGRDDPDPVVTSRKIRAYLRCSPRDHKLLSGALLFNVAFVLLLILKRVPGKIGSPTQSLLFAVPSVILAYLAYQQRHYYSHATRRQRGVLWIYLGISTVFLVTLAFSHHNGSENFHDFHWFAATVTWLMGISSAIVFMWYFPRGHTFDRTTKKWTENALKDRPTDATASESDQSWQYYDAAVHRYCSIAFHLTVLAGLLMAVGMLMVWLFY